MLLRARFPFLLALLLPAVAATAEAGGQNRLFAAKAAIRTVFWPQVYSGGGTTLWCQARFTEPGSRITADAIYQVPWIRDAIGCNARQPCENTRDFQRMTADLHN